MNMLESLFKDSDSPHDYVAGYCQHIASLVQSLDTQAIAELIALVEKAAEGDDTIFLVGNGGGASVATQYVLDIGADTVVEGQPGLRVMSLSDNASSITALGNDVGFDAIFERQLMANMREGDLVILMSVSGNSPNVVRAAEYANAHGGVTVGCTGITGGKLKELSQLSIHTPSTADEYGPVEDMYSVIMHALAGYLRMKRGQYLAH